MSRQTLIIASVIAVCIVGAGAVVVRDRIRTNKMAEQICERMALLSLEKLVPSDDDQKDAIAEIKEICDGGMAMEE
jgi:hypothetical protein